MESSPDQSLPGSSEQKTELASVFPKGSTLRPAMDIDRGWCFRVVTPTGEKYLAFCSPAKLSGLVDTDGDHPFDDCERAKTLKHPNILTPIRSAKVGHRTVVVTDDFAGQPLFAIMRNERHPIKTVGKIFEQVAAAMIAAHESGVFHRALSPANILVDEELNVRVVGFGMANVFFSRWKEMLKAGERSYSHYIAPEILSDGFEKVMPHCDVFAMGRVTYELMMGHVPRNSFVDLPSQHCKVPQYMDDALLRAMHGIPWERPQTVAAFRELLIGKQKREFKDTVAKGFESFNLYGQNFLESCLDWFRDYWFRFAVVFAVITIGFVIWAIITISRDKSIEVADGEKSGGFFGNLQVAPPWKSETPEPPSITGISSSPPPVVAENPLPPEYIPGDFPSSHPFPERLDPIVRPPESIAAVRNDYQVPLAPAQTNYSYPNYSYNTRISVRGTGAPPSTRFQSRIPQNWDRGRVETFSNREVPLGSELKNDVKEYEEVVVVSRRARAQGNLVSAEAALSRAVELFPNSGNAQHYHQHNPVRIAVELTNALEQLKNWNPKQTKWKYHLVVEQNRVILDLSDHEFLVDLAPLNKQIIHELNLTGCGVTTLKELRGMPLDELRIDHTPISDLGPASEMPLRVLTFRDTKIKDVSVLQKITTLRCVLGDRDYAKIAKILPPLPGQATWIDEKRLQISRLARRPGDARGRRIHHEKQRQITDLGHFQRRRKNLRRSHRRKSKSEEHRSAPAVSPSHRRRMEFGRPVARKSVPFSQRKNAPTDQQRRFHSETKIRSNPGSLWTRS